MQKLRFSRYFKAVFILSDIFLLGVFFYLPSLSEEINKFTDRLSYLAVLVIFWILLSTKTKIYLTSRLSTFTKYIERLFSHLIVFLVGVYLLSMVFITDYLNNHFYQIIVVFCIAICFLKLFVFFGLKLSRYLGYNVRNIMFLENNESSKILKNTLTKRKDFGYKIFDTKYSNNIQDLELFWKEKGIYSLFIPLYSEKYSQQFIQELIESAEKNDIKVYFVPDIILDEFLTYHLTYAVTQPILEKTAFPLENWEYAFIKRLIDIALSLIFLILIASWLFPIIAIIIKLNSKGDIFFKQKRYGYKDRIFWCYKFRSMYENNDSQTKTTEKDDHRITKVGKFLRKTSLDELPQFFNVLIGNMSIIGPRPHMLSVDDYYKVFINKYNIRSKVKPGITGLAQISGLRGGGNENENMNMEMRKRILADAYYVKNWSFSLDMIIILKTIILLLKGDKRAY